MFEKKFQQLEQQTEYLFQSILNQLMKRKTQKRMKYFIKNFNMKYSYIYDPLITMILIIWTVWIIWEIKTWIFKRKIFFLLKNNKDYHYKNSSSSPQDKTTQQQLQNDEDEFIESSAPEFEEFSHDDEDNGQENDYNCPICFATISLNYQILASEFALLNKCGHIFCVQCIDHWSKQQLQTTTTDSLIVNNRCNISATRRQSGENENGRSRREDGLECPLCRQVSNQYYIILGNIKVVNL